MKRVTAISLLFATVSALVPQCVNFMSDFNRIEEKKLRVIGVAFLPGPDYAPGDTVTARAYFAGSGVERVDKFTLTFKGYGDQSGVLFDEEPVRIISSASWLPDSFQYSFVIPDSVFFWHRAWNLDSLVSDSMAAFMRQPKDTVVSIVSALSAADQTIMLDRINRLSLGAVGFFTAHAKNETSLRVMGAFSVRYNARYPEYCRVNRNPTCSWIAAYQVPRKYAMGFNPYDLSAAGHSKKTWLFNAQHPDSADPAVVIDTGYSYFFACDNGVAATTDSAGALVWDTLSDVDEFKDGTPAHESYFCQWFYQNLDPVTDVMDSMLVLDDLSAPCIEFKPPIVCSMRHFRIWTAVYDEFMGSNSVRPRGVCVKGVSGVFRFTDAYIRAHGQR